MGNMADSTEVIPTRVAFPAGLVEAGTDSEGEGATAAIAGAVIDKERSQ